MSSEKVIVYVNDKLGTPAGITLLPEVAASFGLTDGQRITPEQAAEAEFVNAIQALSNMVDDVYETKRLNKKRGAK